MLFMDRSVGGNISDGLTCLGYASDEAAPSHCKRFTHVDPRYSLPATEVNWSRTGGYSRANWDYLYWPTGCDSWDSKLGCFFDLVDQQPGAYQVVSYQFSYLEVETGSTIDDLPGGFFANNAGKLDVYDLEAFQAQHPELTVIHWTTSLARGIGTAESESFNAQLRQYALTHNQALLDAADILSHDPAGQPCYDNRDGVSYLSENYPSDGLNRLAICQHHTTETDGGHLGSVSAGKIRVAKAVWVLMAQLAGWQPGAPPPTPGPPPSYPEHMYLPLLRR
jgi:hypothetical protein